MLVKSFALELTEGNPASRKWIETRFLTKQDGEWFGYSYVWNDDRTDADAGATRRGWTATFTIQTATGERKQTWHYPSRAECMVCHSRAANFVLGLCDAADEQGPRLRRPRPTTSSACSNTSAC